MLRLKYLRLSITSCLFVVFQVAPSFCEAQASPANDYCISGTLKDSADSGPVRGAEIKAVFDTETGPQNIFVVSDSTGRFVLCSRFKARTLTVSHEYYTAKTISLAPNTLANEELGIVLMTSDAAVLTGGGVRAKKEQDKIEVDHKKYSVGGSVLSTGGTAIDVLRQIPAVNVDADGNISLRGSNNVTIYINGKQSSLSGADRLAMLTQIPAANIESVDVNTNPGAKQDAEGMSGIINIILKQNTTKGRSGYVTLGAGNRNKYNGSGNFNFSNSKWNISNTLSFRQNDIWGKGYNERRNFTTDSTYFINQYSRGRNLYKNFALSGNVDYNLTRELALSANYMISQNIDREDDTNTIHLGNRNDSLQQLVRRSTHLSGTSVNTDVGVSMKKIFGKPAHNLFVLVNYSGTSRKNQTDIVQDELNTLTEEAKSTKPYLLYNRNRNHFSNTLVQIDYTKPLKANIKLETGLKFTGRNLDNYFMVDSFDYASSSNMTDSGKTNHFIYSENVSAVYGMITRSAGDLIKYNLGLRLENTSILGQQIMLQEGFVNNYANLFPSGNINVALQKKYKLPDVQLSYSRRINRPGQWSLNPFVTINDPYNVSKGNPKLKPELTDAFELSAYYNTKPLLVTATFYFRQTNSPISRYRTIDSAGISTVSFYNLDFNRSTGAELVTRFTVLKDIRLTLNGNLYKYVITGNVEGNDFITQRIMYSGKANLNYTWKKKVEFQSSFFYMGPMITPQGTIRSMYGLEAGVKSDVLKDKLSLSLNLSDVLNNRRFNIVMTDPQFTGAFYRKRESRIITFNATWKFGKPNAQAEKKPRIQEPQMTPDY